ncbi:unnamed protein product [Lathyrus oleraceus]
MGAFTCYRSIAQSNWNWFWLLVLLDCQSLCRQVAQPWYAHIMNISKSVLKSLQVPHLWCVMLCS